MAITRLSTVTAKNFKPGLRSLGRLALALMIMVPFAAYASVRMENIEFSTLPGDKTEIKMTFDGPPPKPTGYTIEQPARIALDLKDVTSGLKSKYHPLGNGNARSVTVMEAGDRTRVIVSLTDLVSYKTRIDGDSLYLLVGKSDGEGFVQSTETFPEKVAAESSSKSVANSNAPQIENIDFRRGEEGQGRVVVKLSDPGVGIDVSSEGGKIRIEFTGVHIPVSLQRRLDVTDFATPVVSVDSLPEADNTVIMVQPKGEYDYLAYQADNIFTLEVKPLTSGEREASLDQHFKYRGEKLSLNFQDIEIRSVLQLIADFTDLNLVASDTVKGRITLRLKNVPWDQALDIILKSKGLDKRKVGNVLMVAPASELAAREKLELESKQQASELAPLKTEFIPVRYAKAADLVSLFQTTGKSGDSTTGGGGSSGAGVISSRGSIAVDARTNSIIITDTVEKINQLRELLEKLDVPVRQVMIEARIVQVNANSTENLGIKWGLAGRGSYNNGKTLTQVGPTVDSLASIAQTQADGSSLSGTLSPDALTVDFGTAGSSQMAFGFLRDNILLDLELDALESEGKSESIARPRVITSDKQTAHIEDGQQIPYQSSTSSGATNTSFASATLSLDVTPQITPDDRILLDLSVTNDEPDRTVNPPSIATKRITTKVLVNNGETLVLGGIYTLKNGTGVQRTPLLGELPVVGRLFRATTDTSSKSETLIFITPRLIKNSLSK